MRWHLKHREHGIKPWAVQAEAMRRSEGAERYGYHLEQGLGKTALILNDFVHYEGGGKVDCIVVLAPNSFKTDWIYAPDEWGIEGLPADVSPHLHPPVSIPFLWAVNYEAARSSLGSTIAQLMKKRRVFLCLDETTEIKNPQAQTTKIVMELAKDAAMVRTANGTPLVQNVMDYFGPLKCLGELDRTNPYAFRNRYARMGGYMGKQVVGFNEDRKPELMVLLDRVSFRALKVDWRKDLPPQTFQTVHIEMTALQRKFYRQMLEEFAVEIGGREITADMVLTQMNKLQQISSCLAFQDGGGLFFEPRSRNPKILAALEIASHGTGKTVVSHFYRPTGEALLASFQEEGFKPARIAGGMKPGEVIEEKRRFNEDPACRVLVGQVTATARGHTLIGQKGDRVNKMVFVENSFSYMHRAQMQDRIHRGAADETCSYFDLVASPMDQTAVDILTGKRDAASSVDQILTAIRREISRERR